MKVNFLLTITTLLLNSIFAIADDVPEYDKWAAVAFSRERAVTGSDPIGRAYSEGSEWVAKDMAIRSCNSKDCEIKVYVNTGCIGIAKGQEIETGYNWWGFGASQYAPIRIGSHIQTPAEAKASSQKAAGEAAKVACDSASHSLTCNIIEVFCTWDTGGGASSALHITRWIHEMGGETSYELRNVLQTVNVASQSALLNIGINYSKSSCLVTRRWTRVSQFAEVCGLNTYELDRLYGFSNR